MSGPAARPLYVLRGPSDLAAVVRHLASDGWTVRTGLSIPDEPWDLTASRTVVTGPVADDLAVASAVLAAARGAGVVAVTVAESSVGQALLADLARIGPVRRAPASPTSMLAEKSLVSSPSATLLSSRCPMRIK